MASLTASNINYEVYRIRTFKAWPSYMPWITPKQLAKEGLYYLGYATEVLCFSCNVTISVGLGDSIDEVISTHELLSPSCDFVNHVSNNVPEGFLTQAPLCIPLSSRQSNPVFQELQTHRSAATGSSLEPGNHQERAGNSGARPQQVPHSTLFTYNANENIVTVTSQFQQQPAPLLPLFTCELKKCACTSCTTGQNSHQHQHPPIMTNAEPVELRFRHMPNSGPEKRVRSSTNSVPTQTVSSHLQSRVNTANSSSSSSSTLTSIQQQPLFVDQNPVIPTFQNQPPRHGGIDETGNQSSVSTMQNSGPTLLYTNAWNMGCIAPSEFLSPAVNNQAETTMACVDNRLSSFRSWNGNVSFEDLALSGFFYTGVRDRVQCFTCNIVLRDWKHEDIPWVEHQKHSPSCAYIAGTTFTTEYMKYWDGVLIESNAGNGQLIENLQPETHSPYNENAASVASTSSWTPPSRITLHSGPVAVIPTIYGPGPIEMSDMNARRSTFDSWTGKAGIADLVIAGFFYTGIQDRVQCFNCSGVLHQWNASDSAWSEHVKHFPFCSYIMETDFAVECLKFLNNTISNTSQEEIDPEINKVEPMVTGSRNKESDEVRDLKERITCKICMESEVNVVFIPCGHFVACGKCSTRLNRCAICRKAIKHKYKTFFS